MIDVNKLKSIKMSLMKMNSNVDKKGLADYTKFSTASFTIPENFFEGSEEAKELRLRGLIGAMYVDLLNNLNFKEDSLGMWVDYNGVEFENALLLKTLKDMEDYGPEDVDALYEMFKMTVAE